MSIQIFSVTTGNPQPIDVKTPIDPSNPNGEISIQNDGPNTLTVEGKLSGSSSWAALGTVPANTINSISFVYGLVQIQLSATAATGTVIW